MKKKNLFLTTVLGLALGLGVAGGLAANRAAKDVEEVKAAGVSGTISVDLTGEGWADNAGNEDGNGQNISVYFWDDSNTGWGSYTYAGYHQYVVFIDYNLSFTPTHMKAVRYSNWYAESDWKTDPWCTGEGHAWGKWNESSNMEFVANSNIIIAGTNAGESFVGYVYEEGKSAETEWNWQKIADLTGVKLNDSNHIEYYITKTITQWEEFGIKIFNSFYAYDACTFSKHVDTSNWKKEGNNIQYTNATAKEFSIYFDRNAGTIFINDADYAAADEWSEYFLANVGCDATGATAPTGWSDCATKYSSIRNGAKDIIYAATADESGEYIEQAVARYDAALRSHPTLTKFIKNSGGTPRASRIVINPIAITAESTNYLLVVVLIGTLAVSAVAGYFLLRKKKQK